MTNIQGFEEAFERQKDYWKTEVLKVVEHLKEKGKNTLAVNYNPGYGILLFFS